MDAMVDRHFIHLIFPLKLDFCQINDYLTYLGQQEKINNENCNELPIFSQFFINAQKEQQKDIINNNK